MQFSSTTRPCTTWDKWATKTSNLAMQKLRLRNTPRAWTPSLSKWLVIITFFAEYQVTAKLARKLRSMFSPVLQALETVQHLPRATTEVQHLLRATPKVLHLLRVILEVLHLLRAPAGVHHQLQLIPERAQVLLRRHPLVVLHLSGLPTFGSLLQECLQFF